MGAYSDYLEEKIANQAFGATAYSVPATVYLELDSVVQTEATGGTELSGSNYARVSITNNSTNFPNTASREKHNGTAFTTGTASAQWLPAVGWGLRDAVSAGNLMFYGALTASKTAGSGDALSFPASALSIAPPANMTDYLFATCTDFLLGAAAFPSVATFYLRLYATTIGTDGSGTEISGSSYARQSITNNTTNFPSWAAGVKSNGAAINFPAVTSTPYTVYAWGLFDAATGGNCWARYNFTSPVTLAVGDAWRFNIAELQLLTD